MELYGLPKKETKQIYRHLAKKLLGTIAQIPN